MKTLQTTFLSSSHLVRALFLQLLLLPFFTTFLHAQTICNNATGSHGGFTYSYWKSRGNGCMTLKSGGGFTIDWNNVGNLLARKAKRPGSFNQVVTYDVDFKPDTSGGRSFVSIYGWTQNPLIEYYIVEAWSHSRPTKGTRLGTIYSDGSEYDLYRTQRVNKPSIEGTKTFYQYWSVRRTKRTKGTVTTANHFNGWRNVGLELGSLWEVSLVIEALKDSAGFADVKSMSMTVGTTNNDKDDIVSVSAPSSVERGKNVSVSVNYSASTNRDVIAVFQLDQSPWTTYASQKKDVSAGSGTLTFNFTIPSDTPVANDKYQFQTFITTNNGGWDNRLDNIAKTNVDVVNGGSGPGDDISEGVYRFQNASTNQYMDSDGNGMVRLNNSNGNPDQEWGLHALPGGFFNIDSRHNGRGLLDTDPNGVVKWSSAGPVNTNEGFQWKPIKLGNGNYRFENRIGGRKYLRYNGNNRVVGYSNTADKRSEWKLTRVGGLKGNISEVVDENTNIVILPNPAVSKFEIRFSGLKNTAVSIVNMQGQLLGKYLVTEDQLFLDASNWSSGIYFVNAIDESGTQISNKFLVK